MGSLKQRRHYCLIGNPRVIGDIATVFKWALYRRVRGRSTSISYTTIIANKCKPRGCDRGKRCLAANRLSSPSRAGLLQQQGKENTFLPQIYERNLTTAYRRQNRAWKSTQPLSSLHLKTTVRHGGDRDPTAVFIQNKKCFRGKLLLNTEMGLDS